MFLGVWWWRTPRGVQQLIWSVSWAGRLPLCWSRLWSRADGRVGLHPRWRGSWRCRCSPRADWLSQSGLRLGDKWMCGRLDLCDGLLLCTCSQMNWYWPAGPILLADPGCGSPRCEASGGHTLCEWRPCKLKNMLTTHRKSPHRTVCVDQWARCRSKCCWVEYTMSITSYKPILPWFAVRESLDK